MDQYYDTREAKHMVHSLSEERVAKDELHLSRLYRETTVLEGMQITSDDDEQTCQSITLTGFNGKSFDDAICAIREIQCTGEREFHQGQLQEWLPVKLQGYDAVEMSNRYFRTRSKTERETGIPIRTDVDPKGNNLIHMEENVVKYYRGIMDAGKKKYMGAKPHMFRTGDIVEAQCSVVFVRCKGGSVKTKLVLHAIAMVNCEHTMVGGAPSAVRMKRKVGFKYEGEAEETHEKSKKHQDDVQNDEQDSMLSTEM
ncbi:uncharacterized protein EV420DRAFT_1480831 [Desarmillaria tabescens]|uniref:Uncharacterized protein n=1 Tax=Armillaria tabescens TaxID=1929756 RepID=A0AA39KA82_ARMTA|nr:uncharacterized protein EV420DRAFT_1480831 [Desarmillaria tabescens]KAK0457360.1 hypothetical protein EV420DRAFT_1480831 [Desarmillaria tabescens]